MEQVELNLTRKWRSKNFQEIVGQSLAVRILQNSLYLKQFFPVYLFAGQRGCGKTSTARVFAAAVNCEKLEEFQKNPRSVQVPCLQCASCVAMQQAKHPDFIEIDAASYTGVDNVRNIIDASSFLPLLGKKKIYLIDEAHMLSKAAFNAFLKILEEPPPSVLFILATTDMHKILETVKSRCFQIFFDPVQTHNIVDHLQNMCEKENIAYDLDGLTALAKESQGSVRDAINLLEQVRFAAKKVSQDAVLNVLGHIDETTLCTLFEKVLDKDVQKFLTFSLSLQKHALSVEYIWKQMTELAYDAVLLHYKVPPRIFTAMPPGLQEKIISTDIRVILQLFDMLCLQEGVLAKTSKKLLFFEMTLLQFIMDEAVQVSKKKNKQFLKDAHDFSSQTTPEEKWQQFLIRMQDAKDVVLLSMFQESKFIQYDDQEKIVTVSFLKKFVVFQDMLEDQVKIWLPLLKETFESEVRLDFNFTITTQQPSKIIQNHDRVQPKSQSMQTVYRNKASTGKGLDISDKQKWKLAHTLLEHFDGTISEISGDIYE